MDVIFSSSRGRDLYSPLSKLHRDPEYLYIYTRGGATLKSLQYAAYDYLDWTSDPTNCHVYFVAGMCDLTFKDTDRRWSHKVKYEEVLFKGSALDTITRMTHLIDCISGHTLFMGAKPCFATILPMSLRTWNNYRLEQGKTSFLLHHNHYVEMQEAMNFAIRKINQHIHAVNASNTMVTPSLASSVVEYRGLKKPRVYYSRFTDGVHPGEDLIEKWAKLLDRAIVRNRSRY